MRRSRSAWLDALCKYRSSAVWRLANKAENKDFKKVMGHQRVHIGFSLLVDEPLKNCCTATSRFVEFFTYNSMAKPLWWNW